MLRRIRNWCSLSSLSDKARTMLDYYKTYDVYILECLTVSEVLFDILTSLAKLKEL